MDTGLAHIYCYTLPPWPPPVHTSQQNTPDRHRWPSRPPLYAADRRTESCLVPPEWRCDRCGLRPAISQYHDPADAVIDGAAILALDPDVPLIVHTHEGPHVTFIFLSMTHGAPRDLMRIAAGAKPCGADVLRNWAG